MSFDTDNIFTFSAIDNNDGWAILDVTDPADPGLCFLASDSPRKPIIPREYLEIDGSAEVVDEGVLDALDAVRLLEKQDLAEAFPKLFRLSSSTESPQDVPATEAEGVPSLVTLATQIAMQKYLDNPNDTTISAHLDVAAHREDLLVILRAQQPFPDSRVEVLVKIISDTDVQEVLRLTGFTGLSIEQMSTIVSQANAASASAIHTLDLSNATNLDAKSLLVALPAAAPSLRRIIILNTNISVEEMDDLLISQPKLFYTLRDIIHPTFHSRSLLPNTKHH